MVTTLRIIVMTSKIIPTIVKTSLKFDIDNGSVPNYDIGEGRFPSPSLIEQFVN